MKGSELMKEKLNELKTKRKEGEIGAKEFYLGLLSLVAEFTNSLKEEDINESDIKSQIPLILSFLESQIKKMGERGH